MKKKSLLLNRLRLAVYILLTSVVITGLRLIDVQLIKGAYFQERANANRTFTRVIPRERGLILDRFGKTLVMNQPVYYRSLNPERLYSDRQLIDRETALQTMATESALVSMELRRHYLLGAAGGHVLGYSGPVTAEDLRKDKDLQTTDLIGKQGLERIFDTVVRGRPGKEVYEVDALGKKQKLMEVVAGTAGFPIQTTIDPYLTTLAYKAMGTKTGAVVIEDANTGEVLALVSTPSFDPNVLSNRFSDETAEKQRQLSVQEAFSHPKQLFFNRTISGAYPPGSVFKLVTAAAGLSSGAVTTSTTVIDEGILKVGEYSYSNWYFTQYGRVEGEIGLRKSISRSNDIFFYKAAEWIGPDKLAAAAREFGFGKKTGIELLSEREGLVPDPAWKEETLGERWFLGNTYHYGIGQGDILVTPLQVAQMTQAIANRGSLCLPHIVKKNRSECIGLSVMDEHLEEIVAGMIDACSSGGTAYPLFPWNAEHGVESDSFYEKVAAGTVACKTGTAEFGATDSRGYKKTHGWFTMFVGMNEVLKENGLASGSAQLNGIATESAQLSLTATASASSSASAQQRYDNYDVWKKMITENGFPAQVVITVLVESDEAEPYKEGSREAAPVAKAILDWMVTGKQPEEQHLDAVTVPSDALPE